jgi:hypothetical protein
MEFQIENWPDYEPVKHLRVQVTYNGLAPSISGLSAIHQDGFFSTSTHVATTPFAPNQLLFEYDIFPNPVFELFHLDVPPGTSIDQVVIDTISIPEPTTIGLMGFGALAFIKRSRRK